MLCRLHVYIYNLVPWSIANMFHGLFQKPNWMVSEKEQAEARAPLEYPSPVSVLDNNEHTDDLPSPVKQVGMTLKGNTLLCKRISIACILSSLTY